VSNGPVPQLHDLRVQLRNKILRDRPTSVIALRSQGESLLFLFAYVQFLYDPILGAVSRMIIILTLGLLVLIERFVGYERLL
jgi:hypothetical protein